MRNEGRGKKLSVARELLLLAASVDALRQAAERNLDADNQESLPEFAFVMAGSLMVLRDRLRLVERILMSAANPSSILCRANQADPSEDGPGIVREWSPAEEVERLEAEWRGARYRRDTNRQPPVPAVVITTKKFDGRRSN